MSLYAQDRLIKMYKTDKLIEYPSHEANETWDTYENLISRGRNYVEAEEVVHEDILHCL